MLFLLSGSYWAWQPWFQNQKQVHYVTNKWGRLREAALGHACCMGITAMGDLQLTQVWPSQDTMD